MDAAESMQPTAIGVDLGGTQVRAARVDAAGRVLAVRRVATDPTGPDAVADQILALAEILRDGTTRAIGLGVPGAIDAAAGTVLNIPALAGWAGYPLAATLAGATGLPCILENDAKVAALGEWRAGAGRGCSNFAYVTVGTGIGGAMVVDGRLLRGSGGLAGEVGHTHVTDRPERCACGRTGCWQAVASGTALGLRAQATAAAHPGSAIARFAGDGPATGFHVAEAARAGDPLARGLLDEVAGYLGLGFANVQHCYAPERIVMGGGLSMLLDLLRPRLEAALRAGLLPGFAPAEVQAAALGDDAGLIGAALQAGMARG